jgi:benzoyl-CoA reductase/2-hydroxyglutaryl-CoA dehydratase subunit BcrC/BadD/HgdB
MDPIFNEAAIKIQNSSLLEYKEKGGRVIGYVCSHVPEEVIAAADMLPFRLRGIEIKSTAIGDSYFGPFVCSCPKALLQNAGEGRFSFLDGAIMVQACDSMRRLDECWRKAGKDFPGSLPDFFHYFAVPHKVTDYSVQFFAEEIEKLAKAIEGHFKVSITEQKLDEAIETYNTTRDLLVQLEALRHRDSPPLTGSEAMAIVLAGTAMPKSDYNKLLEATIEDLKKQRAKTHAGKPRILLAGSVVDDLTLIDAIEAEGAVVVADTVCFGARAYAGHVEKGGSRWETLARRYLNEQFCPRMFGYSNERYELILQKFKDSKADGIVFQNIRFCDLHGSENGLFNKRLDKAGIPNTRIEREYGELADEGRVRMRINAFLETLGRGKSAA